ncbi:MAG: ATP-binding protein [Turicibacter sp.]|nr:ATP-binding protein [Turicibacter sp.]
MEFCKLHFESETRAVKEQVNTLLDFVDDQHPASEARFDLKLIFSELLYNAVIHGNKRDTKKNVHVMVTSDGERILAAIKDEGAGFNYDHVLKLAASNKIVFEESGHGIALVCALTDTISFNRSGNCIRFEKSLK